MLAVSNSSVFMVVWEWETREIQEAHGADNLLFSSKQQEILHQTSEKARMGSQGCPLTSTTYFFGKEQHILANHTHLLLLAAFRLYLDLVFFLSC